MPGDATEALNFIWKCFYSWDYEEFSPRWKTFNNNSRLNSNATSDLYKALANVDTLKIKTESVTNEILPIYFQAAPKDRVLSSTFWIFKSDNTQSSIPSLIYLERNLKLVSID